MVQEFCFSKNKPAVASAFKDYMNTYFAEVKKDGNYSYDKTLTFAEKEQKMNKLMRDEIARVSNFSLGEDSLISPEMIAQNPMIRWASFAVANALIDMVLPDILDKSVGMYTETKNGAMGDSFLFTVKPNDLFYVSKAGRNQRTVEFQRQDNTQVSVLPENREISVNVNLYKVVCGFESLADFVMKAALAVEAQITRELFTAFDTAMGGLPATPADGNLKVAGWSQKEAVRLASTVTAFNGGNKAIFLGTPIALQSVLPTNSNYRYDIESPFVKVGYMQTAFGYDTMVLPQVADWRNPYKLALRDDRIYVISPALQKPVKLCFEGASTTSTIAFQQNADLSESTTINKSYGIGIATNAIAGLITLA